MPTAIGTYSVAGEGFVGRIAEAPIHITIDPSFVQPDSDGNRICHPLTWWVGPREAARPLPATLIATAATAGDTDLVVDNAAYFQVGETLGALGDITAIDMSTNTITIDTALAANLAVGDAVDVDVAPEVVLGISRTELNLEDTVNLNQGIYTKANIVEASLPYYDSTILAAFPQITLV